MEYYDFYEEERYCYDCHDKQHRLSEITSFMEEVVRQVYSKNDQINEEILDHCISEICHYLKIKLPKDMPSVCRKNRITGNFQNTNLNTFINA